MRRAGSASPHFNVPLSGEREDFGDLIGALHFAHLYQSVGGRIAEIAAVLGKVRSANGVAVRGIRRTLQDVVHMRAAELEPSPRSESPKLRRRRAILRGKRHR